MRPDMPLAAIKGVGPKTADTLASAGFTTARDLVYLFPRQYEDFTQVASISSLQPGNVVVKGKISNISSRYVRRGLHITQAVLSDATGKVALSWFNQPYRAKHIAAKGDWLVAGEFVFSNRRYQILNPSVRHSDEIVEEGVAIIPIYRQIAGIKTAAIRALLTELRPLISMWQDPLPDALTAHFKLISYADALLQVHFPESPHELMAAKERLAFQEMLELLYAAFCNKADNESLEGWPIKFDTKPTQELVGQLPFQLTDDQRIAAWEIISSMQDTKPMNRLLQGDVGSGKTVVAGIAAFVAARAGFQTAVLAPTELLARQHATTLSSLLEPFGVSVGLLVGSASPKAKQQLKESISSGAVAITVGTQALLQQSVSFHRLGFVVIDEQHRFGVKQRQELLKKSRKMPHVLSMTATPIPRSLQLTVYGDLDVSILRQKPTGRKSIQTKIVSPASRAALLRTVDEQIAQGRQVYVVCPLIEGDDSELRTVTSEYERLRKTALKHRRIGLLHGKLNAQDKEHVMKQFVDREFDVLVATTVVEVGVDVPNATVIIIEGAERFGLAQLHQLRGRVGRSGHQSYCYIVPTESRQTTNQRLRELAASDDGFYLAEKDLEMRGPGEIYGTAQHGQLNLQIAHLNDMQLVKQVRIAIAYSQQNSIDLLQYQEMRDRVNVYRRLTTLN